MPQLVVVSMTMPFGWLTNGSGLSTAPEVLGLLRRIQEAGAVVVEVPDDDRATLALIRRTAITEAGLALRQAYLALAARVVEAKARETGR